MTVKNTKSYPENNKNALNQPIYSQARIIRPESLRKSPYSSSSIFRS